MNFTSTKNIGSTQRRRKLEQDNPPALKSEERKLKSEVRTKLEPGMFRVLGMALEVTKGDDEVDTAIAMKRLDQQDDSQWQALLGGNLRGDELISAELGRRAMSGILYQTDSAGNKVPLDPNRLPEYARPENIKLMDENGKGSLPLAIFPRHLWSDVSHQFARMQARNETLVAIPERERSIAVLKEDLIAADRDLREAKKMKLDAQIVSHWERARDKVAGALERAKEGLESEKALLKVQQGEVEEKQKQLLEKLNANVPDHRPDALPHGRPFRQALLDYVNRHLTGFAIAGMSLSAAGLMLNRAVGEENPDQLIAVAQVLVVLGLVGSLLTQAVGVDQPRRDGGGFV